MVVPTGAFAKIESGNPNAVNPDSGAWGSYQIMPSNWASWAREAGVDPTDRSAAAQKRVAEHKMQQYYDQFGSWDAVAVAWYGGPAAALAWLKDPNAARFNAKQGGGKYPSVNEYVANFRKANGSQLPTRQTGGNTLAAGGTQTMATPTITLPGGGNDMLSAYGWASVFADVPELKAILDKAAKDPNMTPALIEAAVRNSNFYKQRNSNQIQWEVDRRLHPQDVDQKRNDLTRSVQQMATKMGFTLNPARANTLSGYALAMGWTDSQITDAVQREFHFDPTHPQGDAGALMAKLKQTAHSFFTSVSDGALSTWVEGIEKGTLTEGGFETMVKQAAKQQHPEWAKAIDAGVDPKHYLDQSASLMSQFRQASHNFFVPISDGALKNWVDNVVLGTTTEDQFNQYLKAQAISQFPSMKGAIDQGFDMKTIADPYVQIAAQELNIPDSSIVMTDPKWLEALVQTDPKTGEKVSMNLDSWRTHLRMDPKYGWNQTMGATNMAADFADKINREMGAVK